MWTSQKTISVGVSWRFATWLKRDPWTDVSQKTLFQEYLGTAASKPQPPEVLCKKNPFVKVSQYSLENTCVEVSFDKSAGLVEGPVFLWIFLKTSILKNIGKWLLLQIRSSLVFYKMYWITTDFSIQRCIFNYISWIQHYWKVKLCHLK